MRELPKTRLEDTHSWHSCYDGARFLELFNGRETMDALDVFALSDDNVCPRYKLHALLFMLPQQVLTAFLLDGVEHLLLLYEHHFYLDSLRFRKLIAVAQNAVRTADATHTWKMQQTTRWMQKQITEMLTNLDMVDDLEEEVDWQLKHLKGLLTDWKNERI